MFHQLFFIYRFKRIFHYKPSILGYPHLLNSPYIFYFISQPFGAASQPSSMACLFRSHWCATNTTVWPLPLPCPTPSVPSCRPSAACTICLLFSNLILYHKHAGLSKIGMCTKFGLIGKMLMIQWDWGYFNFIVWQIYVQVAWSGKSGQDVFAAHVSPWRRLAIWRTSSNQVEDAKSSKQ